MFNSKEHKVVIATLTQKRAWLKKNIENASLDEKIRKENIDTLQALESALQKLASTSQKPDAPKAPVQSAKPSKRTNITVENTRFLVAEDNDDSAQLLMEILKDIGIKNADLAKDGIEAFDFIKRAEAPYDIILCDWDMPGLSGLDVHKRAKASNTLKGAHFVMVTAVSEAARIREAVQQGVNDYIVKPIDIDTLEAKIKAALENKED